MTSSLKRPSLSKPKKGERISQYNLSFARARNKNKAHSRLLELFQESKLSKRELASMVGKKPEQITRWLAGPGNLTLDTLSDLIFAISGHFYVVETKDDLARAKSNHRTPEWLHVISINPKQQVECRIRPETTESINYSIVDASHIKETIYGGRKSYQSSPATTSVS